MTISHEISALAQEQRAADDIITSLHQANQIDHWANRQITDLEKNFSITITAATILHHKLVRAQCAGARP